MKKEIFESPLGFSYTKTTLQNGLDIYVMEKQNCSSSFAVFGTKFGSVDMVFDLDGERVEVPKGIAHYLEHKLFESEEGDAFSLYAKTGASANAYTSFDRTCYLFSCADNFYENFKILLNLVTTPYFTDETVKKEQGIIGQEIKMYDDSPSWRVLCNMLSAMYKCHTVRYDIAGSVESIAEITPDLLYKCYKRFYSPSNMFICVAGNVDTEKIVNMAESFVTADISDTPESIMPDEPDEVIKPYVEQHLAVLVPMFCYGFKQKMTSHRVSAKDRICMALLLEILVGDASPLYEKLLNKGLINDEFDYEYFTGQDYAAVMFEGESSDPKRVAKEINAEIERLKVEGIDKKLFSAVKCGLYGDAVRKLDKTEGIVSQFVECAVNDSEFFEEIRILKTTTADDVLRRLSLFRKDCAVLSVIKPLEEK